MLTTDAVKRIIERYSREKQSGRLDYTGLKKAASALSRATSHLNDMTSVGGSGMDVTGQAELIGAMAIDLLERIESAPGGWGRV